MPTKKRLKRPVRVNPKMETATPKGPKGPDVKAPIPGEPQGGLSIGDLKNLSTVLDVASTRGAFRANEMATVGLIYNKLQAFLAKVAPPDPKKEGAPTTGTTPAPVPGAAPATQTGVGKI